MNILLTNDDGIHAPGIYALYQELKKVGKVTVVAPDSERSSIGHAITLSHPIWHKKFEREGKFFGYCISGTPADCVKFACHVILKKKPDIVVSGVNWGANDGCSVFYSGTVAGAREGALLGIPSMAISLSTYVDPDFRCSAKVGAKLARFLSKNKLEKGTFLNVNVPSVPASKIKGIVFTKQGMIPIHGTFHKRRDPLLRDYYWMTGRQPMNNKDISVDTYAVSRNYVAVTPVHCDTTDYRSLEKLSKIKI